MEISLFLNSEASLADEIENALFARTEFFGTEAVVPFPTATARKRLGIVLEKYPNDPSIYLKLSELDEKLENYSEAESNMGKFVELQSEKLPALNELASFFNRRGMFDKQADVLYQMLNLAPIDQRGQFFALLINHAKTHKLDKYLKADFYNAIIANDPSVFSIFEQYLDKLIADRNYEEAIRFLKESRHNFPSNKEYFVRKQVFILISQRKIKDAENVYCQAFEPTWSDDLSGEFYSFLNENDRFRAFGNELRKKFKQNPEDFDAAIRLMHYLKYDGEPTRDVVLNLEKAKNREKRNWSADELLTISIFSISEGNADLASRFLYSLFLKPEAQKDGQLRAKILYQLFALLSDAENDRIALTKGDLNFYRDVAAADTNPGMATGILSLVFADEKPGNELKRRESGAVKLFNRAAAYRIFDEYKREFPKSPELGQMHLDLVRLFTAERDFETAHRILLEFDEHFADSSGFPNLGLKLADAYLVTGNTTEERVVYQQILDHIGTNRTPETMLSTESQTANYSGPSNGESSLEINKGINIPSEKDEPYDDYYYSPRRNYTDFLSRNQPEVTYRQVLQRFVGSLAKEKKTDEILSLYNREIKKYPDEPGLYEDFLSWLGQTNFTDEQLKVYQKALGKFQNKTWRDKLARWYIKNERKQEFRKLSHELIEKFDDKETQEYLWTFVDNTVLSNPSSFESQLFYALHLKAHQRFPHNQIFVTGLLKYFQASGQTEEWRKLLAENYFEMPEVRAVFLDDVSRRGELRNYLIQATAKTEAGDGTETLPYKLFSADAAAKLSNFESSVAFYRELDRLYPNTPEFSERLLNFTRSFGQTDRKLLAESAEIAHDQAEFRPAMFEYRTRSGELRAELGDYPKAKEEWQKLTSIADGEPKTYLDTATIYWDYFQYDEAQATISALRRSMNDPALYAFQMGAIYEAKHNSGGAISEYIKQLGSVSEDDEVLGDISRAKKRLAQLSRRPDFRPQIKEAFQNVAKSQNETLILNYAHYLVRSDQKSEAASILKAEVRRSKSEGFLTQAKIHFEEMEDKAGERQTLSQLTNTARNRKNAISYQLQLAEDFSENGEKEKASDILSGLIKRYPTIYGVLTEADEFYWRIGKRENSLTVLRAGVNLGRGNFNYIFKRKLAARLFELDRIKESEQILVELHNRDASDTGVFDELADIYVRDGKTELLRRIASKTFESIRKDASESRDLNYELAGWRRRLINSFTRLRDFNSAVAQHIEIINRQPDDEENVEAAIKYVRRYGGAGSLLNYYKLLSADSYKNYRWTMVLARIYEADKDYAKSIEHYKLAIHNQPEMVELHASLTDVYEKNNNIDEAIKSIDKVLELTNESPNYMKRKIEILENSRRFDEAKVVREKLTGIKTSEGQTLRDEFAEAERLTRTEKAKALETYRSAFNKVLENPSDSEWNSANIIGYVKTVRQVDSLNEISERLWNLRNKTIAEIEDPKSGDISKARALLSTLDGAMPDAIGNIAVQYATGNELSAIYRDLEERIDSGKHTDKYQSFGLIQNLIARCGFSKLREKILSARMNEAYFLKNSENYHVQLAALLNYYDENGDFTSVAATLEQESSRDFAPGDFDYQQRLADVYKLLGTAEKELQALKNYFETPKQSVLPDDALVARYLEALYLSGENGRATLDSLAERNSPHQIQIINFFIAKNEKDLSHKAIENSGFPEIWKLSRNAETALALEDFDDRASNYFEASLRFEKIGNLVQNPAIRSKLRSDDWYRLTYKFGNWLNLYPNESAKNRAEMFMPAMVENRPKDANEQMNLGIYYLDRKEFARALEHLEIAGQMDPENRALWAKLGIGYFQTGKLEKATKTWEKLIDRDEANLEDCELYFKTLKDYGQAQEATERLLPKIIQFIDQTDDENPSAALLIFLQEISDSILEQKKKTAFWQTLTDSAPKRLFIPKFVVEKSQVENGNLESFYEFLIERSNGINGWESDVDYVNLLETNTTANEAETILDQESNFEFSEPESERLTWQKKYHHFLLENRSFQKADNLISDVEKSLAKSFPRPVWVRLGGFRTKLSKGFSSNIRQEINTFCGINDVLDAKTLNPPNLIRLNEITDVLAQFDLEKEILNLREAFYARSLALEKHNLVNFAGLAEVEFRKDRNKAAVRILQLLIDASAEETSDTSLAKLHSIDLIKNHTPQAPELFEILAEYDLTPASALTIAAELAAKYGEAGFAISCRRKLAEISPADHVNLIELAWLIHRTTGGEEPAQLIASVISNRNATRNERWQAAFISRIIYGNSNSDWQMLLGNLSILNLNDPEMAGAISAFSRVSLGDFAGAIKIIEDSPYQSAHLWFLRSAFHRNQAQNDAELASLIEVRKTQIDFGQTFGFAGENPQFNLLRSYLDGNKPFAALKLASSGGELKFSNSPFELADFMFPTMAERASAEHWTSSLQLLDMLSKAAEKVGEFQIAVEFEKKKESILPGGHLTQSSKIRIGELEQKIRELANVHKIEFRVDENLISK